MGLPLHVASHEPVQMSLALRMPSDYYDWIYQSQQREVIAYTPQQDSHWHVLNSEIARDKLSRWTNEPDVFITPNEFFRWRLIKNVAALNALYIDIDCHHGEDIARRVDLALSALQHARIPEPNAIIYTGRGAHMYWLLHRTHGAALPRWQACQRRLIAITQADRMCADATRVLRVVGSTNTKAANALVRADPICPIRYDFDWLHDQIMPVSRGVIRDLRAWKARKDVVGNRAPAYGSIYQRWYLVYRDLIAIVRHNWSGGQVPVGHRDTILFHMANALSWFTISESLENEIVSLAREITPSLEIRQALSYCSSVVSRAKRSAGGKGEFRYAYKRETLYGSLSDLIPAELLPQLRAIIPDSLAIERKRESNRQTVSKRRHAAGAVARDVYLEAADKKRREVMALREEGLSLRAIGKRLGMPHTTVASCLKAAPVRTKSVTLV